MDGEDLPVGWTRWHEEPGRVILAYRPDVFDGDDLPAPCMPTIYVTRGRRTRRPGPQRTGTDWVVTLYLEPDVDDGGRTFDDRAAAVEAAHELADRFAAGDVDYRALYQVPREAYFDRLDDLTGRGE